MGLKISALKLKKLTLLSFVWSLFLDHVAQTSDWHWLGVVNSSIWWEGPMTFSPDFGSGRRWSLWLLVTALVFASLFCDRCCGLSMFCV